MSSPSFVDPSTDLGTCINEFVALKQRIRESTRALDNLRVDYADLYNRIDMEMKRRGKTRIQISLDSDGTGADGAAQTYC